MNLCATWPVVPDSAWRIFCARQLPTVEIKSVTEVNSTTQDRDVELLRRISRGDRTAFAEFYDLYSALFFSVAIKILRDQKEAEDVLQDVFIQIWEKAGAFDSRLGKPLGWAV